MNSRCVLLNRLTLIQKERGTASALRPISACRVGNREQRTPVVAGTITKAARQHGIGLSQIGEPTIGPLFDAPTKRI